MTNGRNWTNAWRTIFVLGVLAASASYPGPLRATEPGAGFQADVEDSESPELDASEPAMPGKDGTGPAPASMPNKQDREDLLGGEAPLVDPTSRAQALNDLYGQLRSARDAAAAEPITEAIEEAWRNSGSDTVDLLMSRVDGFVLGADLDVALEVLDAVTEIAPGDAEAWHQRAIVGFMKKDYGRALSDLRRALAVDPKHYKAIRDLGVILQQTGDKKGALEAYRKALDVNPFLEQARQAAEELAREVEGQDI
jgi:tetratricopeptide (TPR) repeat protein